MDGFLESVSLLLVLLNPFALSVYLVDMLHAQPTGRVAGILLRAAAISALVFGVFAWGGDAVFTRVLQVRFAAFQVFGGVVFLLFGIRYMLAGGGAIVSFRGEPAHLAGTIAMPFMIGPATVSAAILAGARLNIWMAVLAIVVALVVTVALLMILKVVLDHVRRRNTELIERYVDITGRVTAVVVGTIAVEMIFQGVEGWLKTAGIIGGG